MFKWFLVVESQSPYSLKDWLNEVVGMKIPGKGIVDHIVEWQILRDEEADSYTVFVLCVVKGVI